MASVPTGLVNHKVELLHGSLFVGGGYEGNSSTDNKDNYNLYIYNLSVNHWSSITTPYAFYGMTVLNGKLITVGGVTENSEVTDKILFAGQWTEYNKLPTAKYSVTAVGYQSMLITIGERKNIRGIWTVLTATELLDTTTGVWYTCDHLPAAYSSFRAVIVSETLFLVGGHDDAENKPSLAVLASHLDNLSSHQLEWYNHPDTPWCYSAPAVLHNKYLLTAGGRQPSHSNNKTSEVCVFNPSTNQWKPIANIPVALTGPGVVGVADDKLIVLGGADKQNNFSRKLWIGTIH